MRGDWNVSIRRACRVFLVDTSTYHYKSRRPGQAALEQRIKEICQTRIRYGYRRVHVLLRREWKALPKDLPPKSTVHDYLELWNWDGTLERIHHALYVAVREQAGRDASPTVAIIDSQTAKGAQKGGLGSILRATTRARRSRVASGTSWSTRWASC